MWIWQVYVILLEQADRLRDADLQFRQGEADQ
jgi:hypothetical protein